MACQWDIPSDSLGAIWRIKYHFITLIKNHSYSFLGDLIASRYYHYKNRFLFLVLSLYFFPWPLYSAETEDAYSKSWSQSKKINGSMI